ncbi:hypothetical protein AVEN_259062-1 [Araneus ventricosus]|uniref:Uncharacterized protein n=2 Tax=Araneus ventricosus TaxID=182803 RepID=A0A4Y2U495_ARAVE|nr:hypothetical protein AVEN_259062-1 [Araneus ventricosus]
MKYQEIITRKKNYLRPHPLQSYGTPRQLPTLPIRKSGPAIALMIFYLISSHLHLEERYNKYLLAKQHIQGADVNALIRQGAVVIGRCNRTELDNELQRSQQRSCHDFKKCIRKIRERIASIAWAAAGVGKALKFRSPLEDQRKCN